MFKIHKYFNVKTVITYINASQFNDRVRFVIHKNMKRNNYSYSVKINSHTVCFIVLAHFLESIKL